jgi:hypothetical protein
MKNLLVEIGFRLFILSAILVLLTALIIFIKFYVFYICLVLACIALVMLLLSVVFPPIHKSPNTETKTNNTDKYPSHKISSEIRLFWLWNIPVKQISDKSIIINQSNNSKDKNVKNRGL